MLALSYELSFEVLCLQAADQGRGEVLFGDSYHRAVQETKPFLVGKEFPSVYLEFPLQGDSFLDVTVLLKDLEPNTRIHSPAAKGTRPVLDWYAGVGQKYDNVSLGFELDTKKERQTAAAMHFQPRRHTELVRPFFDVVGEPERADLYLDLDQRMPSGWPLAFFGMFRGRPESPLRVCGYMDRDFQEACANDSEQVRKAFDTIGFASYDDAMLSQVSTLLGTVPGNADFQFDVYDDGTLGSTFAIDAQFGIDQPEKVLASFTDGAGARVARLLQEWGIADDRLQLGVQSTFARALPMGREGDTLKLHSLALMPQWAKVRWINAQLQPAKLYCLANASPLDRKLSND